MPQSELGKLIYDFLAQEYKKHGIADVSCDEDYCTIHVQTGEQFVITIKPLAGND
jgi:hypothetical protein